MWEDQKDRDCSSGCRRVVAYYDTTPTVVTPYFKGINSVAKRPVRVYGGVKIIDGLVGTLANYGWQTIAWSAGGLPRRLVCFKNVFKGDYDTSKVLGPFPAWSKAAQEPGRSVSRSPREGSLRSSLAVQ
jgi:hypothetical protein